MDLSNFYKDFSSNYHDFEVLFQVYKTMMEAIDAYAGQVRDNTAIPDIETYRSFPFQRLSISDATYNVAEVLDDLRIVKKYGLESVLLPDRVSNWNNDVYTLDQKIDMLDVTNNYILLTAKRGFTNEKDNTIIDFHMFDDSESELFRNFDFVLKANKLYLLGDISLSSSERYVTLKNISIDYNTPDSLMGNCLHLSYNDAISKNEYNEILKMLMAASLGGPTLSNLKSAILAIPGFDQGDLYDKFVRDATKRARWNKHNYTDFDFVVAFPEEYAANMEKLTIIIDYLKLVKPAYTKFFVILQSLYSDLYNILVKANDAYNMDYALEHTEDISDLVTSDEHVLDRAIETNDEVYLIEHDLESRLNSLDRRTNYNFYTYGGVHPVEIDPGYDLLSENNSEIFNSGDVIDEDFVLMSWSDTDMYAGAVDSTDSGSLSGIDYEAYDGILAEELVSDNLMQVSTEQYIGSTITENDFSIIAGLSTDSYAGATESLSLGIISGSDADTYIGVLSDQLISDNLVQVSTEQYNNLGMIESDSLTIVENMSQESYNVNNDTYSASTATYMTSHYRLNSATQRLNVDIYTDRIIDEIIYNY